MTSGLSVSGWAVTRGLITWAIMEAHIRLNESAWLDELQLQAKVRHILNIMGKKKKQQLKICHETSIIMISNLKQNYREAERCKTHSGNMFSL